MAFFLAVDAGGTKTDWLLADEHHVLARTRTGTVKRMRTDEATALANFHQGLHTLEMQTGVRPLEISRTCIGAAGVSVPLVAETLRSMWSAQVGGALRLQGDVAIALDAAFHGGPGVLALAGTGSNVAGRAADGSLHTRGGWGPMLADQGSGHAIGAAALRRAMLALDEGRESTLLDVLLDFWQMPSLDALIDYANRTPSPDLSKLTPVVLQCAQRGDAVAAEVLAGEGAGLGYLVSLLLRHLRLQNGNAASDRLAFAGSVLREVALVRDALIAEVLRAFPQCEVLPGVVDPIDGALWRARDEAAFHAPGEWTT